MVLKRSQWTFLGSRIVLIAAIVAVGFVVSAFIREFQRRRAVRHQIQTMDAEVRRIEAQRDRLSDLLEQTGSPEFIEREARLRLGLQKPGETVIVVGKNPGATSSLLEGAQSSSNSNAKKWWQYMFGN